MQVTIQIFLFPLSLEDTKPEAHQDTTQFSSLRQSISDELGPHRGLERFWMLLIHGFHFERNSLNLRLYAATSQFTRPCSILYTVMWIFNAIFNAVLSEGSKVTGIQCWFLVWPLTCRDLSGA